MHAKASLPQRPNKYLVWVGKRYRSLPEPVKSILRQGIYSGADVFNFLARRNDPLTPPTRLRCQVGPYIDANYYRWTAQEFLSYFKDLAHLGRNESVLDVACGCGQMAARLTEYLEQSGSYDGFDISEAAIEWCRKNITSTYPNFHFELVDVFNRKYNPKGKQKSFEWRFPYSNERFDFVFAKSIFEHMLPDDMWNYLSEITRVLKRGGRCMVTFYLLNKESIELIEAGKSTQDFKQGNGAYWTVNEQLPEELLAYDETYVRDLYLKLKLRTTDKPWYGWWCGRKNSVSYADMVLGYKDL